VAPTAVAPPARPPPDDPLARELDLIQGAEAALRAGDASGARALLRRYASEHPRGEMRPEALGVEIRALCALGEREEAARVAARLQALAPRSTPARRIPTTCVGDLREPTSEEPR
jgi:Tfp pilus assembly protein PilF